MTIKVDKGKCIGCGLCISLCPEIFEMGDDGKSQVKNQEGKCEKLQEVVGSCPAGAISIE